MKQYLAKHFLFYSIISLIVIVGIFSYFRFFVYKDYIVEYEGDCDPYTQDCFIGCGDDDCKEEYYYSNMQKYAPDLFSQCGYDITDCDTASVCLPNDRKCSITYCEIDTNGNVCEVFTQDTPILENDSTANINTNDSSI